MPIFMAYILLGTVVIAAWSRSAVRVTELLVPKAAVLGDSVPLSCSYELGSEELYVVKWYKDDMEFYRYEPKDRNQSVYFPQPGIDVDLSRSNSNIVFLRQVALDSEGKYKCQVSTDAPTYSCVQAVKHMNVIVLPQRGPVISGGRDRYWHGDNITLTCTSSVSRPAAVLSWTVNGKQVPDSFPDDQEAGSSLRSATKPLHLKVTQALGQEGRVAVRCQADLLGRVAAVTKEFSITAMNNAPRHISFLNSLSILSPVFSIYLGIKDHNIMWPS